MVVNFDPDDAGANAAESAIQLLLDEGLHVKVLAFGGGSDEHDSSTRTNTVKRFGAEAYRAQLDGASELLPLAGGPGARRVRHARADGRMDAFKFLLPAVQKITDKLERAAVASDLAGYLGVEPDWCWSNSRKPASGSRRAARLSSKRAPASGIPALERILLNALAFERRRARGNSAAPAAGDDGGLRQPRSFRRHCARRRRRVPAICMPLWMPA